MQALLNYSKILKSGRLFFAENFVGPIPFALGFGLFPLLIPAILGTFLSNVKRHLENLLLIIRKPGYLVLLVLLLVFLSSCWGLHIPYRTDQRDIPWAHFPILSILSILTILWIGCLKKNNELIDFIWFFSLGALLFCLITVGATILYTTPPYYSNAIDIRYLFFGIKKSINTPGISNLLCFFPIAFIAGLVLNSNERSKIYWGVGLIGSLLSVAAAALIGQRSYFIVVFIIEPMIVSIFLLLQRSWRPLLAITSCMITLPLMMLANASITTSFVLKRFQEQNLVNDGRFIMFKYWVEHVIADPFTRIRVGPEAWASYQWFHNFFADIHRLSGFWALLAAVIFTVFIFYRLICLIKNDSRLGFFLTAIAIPCFLIMNTSVVPEGEKQPFLLLLAIGAITEVALGRLRDKEMSTIGN